MTLSRDVAGPAGGVSQQHQAAAQTGGLAPAVRRRSTGGDGDDRDADAAGVSSPASRTRLPPTKATSGTVGPNNPARSRLTRGSAFSPHHTQAPSRQPRRGALTCRWRRALGDAGFVRLKTTSRRSPDGDEPGAPSTRGRTGVWVLVAHRPPDRAVAEQEDPPPPPPPRAGLGSAGPPLSAWSRILAASRGSRAASSPADASWSVSPITFISLILCGTN
jgi:hypothetical protein